MKKHYFDYAAATPVDPKAAKAMLPYYSEVFGNPGSIHKFGQEASAAVFKARNKIAKLINCDYREIIFTGSATEANSLALTGAFKASIKNVKIKNFRPRIIVSSVEHESILEAAKYLESLGVEIVYLPVSKEGIVDLKKLKAALNERTVLISVMYVNNEVGAIQPIKEITKIIQEYKNLIKSLSLYPLFHTDAAQAFNYLDCNVENLGVDMMTLSSQKIYGPKGIGLLYVKNAGGFSGEKFISPIIFGGGQEEGLRSGTENVAGIVGFGEAAQIAFDLRAKESARLQKLQNYFLQKLEKYNFVLNGPSAYAEKRLPNNINIYFKNKKDLIFKLDMAGFAVSAGSACSARLARPSRALKAMGCSNEMASESLRISFGRQTDKKSVDKLLKVLKSLL